MIKQSFKEASPIMLSYIFMSIAYGLMMNQAGFAWYYSVLAGLLIYTGAYQYILVSLMTQHVSLFTSLITALFMNSRLLFYGLSFSEIFKKMKSKFIYLVHSLTDEVYAVDLTIKEEEGSEQRMFYIALFSQASWIIGTLIGATIGTIIPFQLEGIDFCMTAMFITILVDYYKKHVFNDVIMISIIIGIVTLLLVGNNFMFISLILMTIILIIRERRSV